MRATLSAYNAPLAAEVDRLIALNEHLNHIVIVLRHAHLANRPSALAKDVETGPRLRRSGLAVKRHLQVQAAKSRCANRAHLPAHLRRDETISEPECENCPDRRTHANDITNKRKAPPTFEPSRAC